MAWDKDKTKELVFAAKGCESWARLESQSAQIPELKSAVATVFDNLQNSVNGLRAHSGAKGRGFDSPIALWKWLDRFCLLRSVALMSGDHVRVRTRGRGLDSVGIETRRGPPRLASGLRATLSERRGYRSFAASPEPCA